MKKSGINKSVLKRLLRYAKPHAGFLLLATREILSALAHWALQPKRQTVNEIFRLCDSQGVFQLLLGRMGVSPAQIARNRAGKELRELWNHSHFLAKL